MTSTIEEVSSNRAEFLGTQDDLRISSLEADVYHHLPAELSENSVNWWIVERTIRRIENLTEVGTYPRDVRTAAEKLEQAALEIHPARLQQRVLALRARILAL